MRRREFLILSGAVATSWPSALFGQQNKIIRVGALYLGNADADSFKTNLREGLRELGYIAGQNIAFEFRSAEGKADQLPPPLVSCTRNQTQILMVTTETASAVAAAALGSCRMELSEAAQALEVWSGGHGCVQGSEKCRESEMAITKAMLPALTAQAMRLRAEAIRKTPR